MTITATKPITLSMADYERDWKPEGWQLIIIGPTSTWRQDWGEWQAIRDIVQNALDETDSYIWAYDDEGLYIRDTGKGVAVADFLLGPPKLKPDYARGKFGEGMKIAALALLRLGYPVRVETVGRTLWIIFLEQKVNGKADTLAAMWRSNGMRRGTVFHVIGYFGTAFDNRFAVNLPRASIVAEGPSQLSQPVRRFNQLIQHRFPEEPGHGWHEKGAGPSRIFARDIYMKDINSPYSYNLWSFDMAPDRHAPKREDDMWEDIGRLWSCVTRVKHLEVFLKMVQAKPLLQTDESFRVSLSRWDLGREPVTGREYADFIQENASVWREAWRNVMHPEPLEPPPVIRTSERLDGMVRHLGYQSVSMTWATSSTLAEVITSDADIVRESQAKLREVEVIPDEKLEAYPLAHIKLARAISGRVFFTPPPVHAAVIPPASDRARTAGMYSTTTGEIYISLEMLEYANRTMDTLIHEMAHHRQFKDTGAADDLTPGHAEAMTRVAAAVVKYVAGGEFDKYLEGVRW